MGYSGRGNGFTYDSLNEYAAIVGVESGRILDYATLNRKCRMCDLGHVKNDHDCRLNFYGSAKAMEAHAAVQLVTDSKILKKCNLQLGVFIADNDASSISAVSSASSHPVIKLSDKNHTSKGVKNMLYQLSQNRTVDADNELEADGIQYLHRCFCYAIAQNVNNPSGLSEAIKNIPLHAFNQHYQCGNWCGFRRNPETYEHKTIPGGFLNPKLLHALTIQFDKLSKNAIQFASAASTQSNESLNCIMARKAPKSTCFSLGASADIRYGCSVLQKNEGDHYLVNVIEEAQMNPSEPLIQYIKESDVIREKRVLKAKTPVFKKRRRELKKIRSQLRNKRQTSEVNTYESDLGLIATNEDENTSPNAMAFSTVYSDELSPFSIIFFDLETAGFKLHCDILQISMKCHDYKFNEYVIPRRRIPNQATNVNGLSNDGTQLYYSGNPVSSSSLGVVLNKLFEFLQNLQKPCLLVAHNASFDAPKLIRAIRNENCIDKFRIVIAGFTDTLPLFRKKFPGKKSKGECTLSSLASKTLSLSVNNAHNADYDVFLLEQLVKNHLTIDNIIENHNTFDVIFESLLVREKISTTLPTLDPLKKIVSIGMMKKLAAEGISYDTIKKSFEGDGEIKTIHLLKKVLKSKKIIDSIINHLKHNISTD